MTFYNFIQAARPKTLTASWVPVLCGTVLAFKCTGLINTAVFLCALASSLFIQVATNFLNDAIDFKKGADTELRVGPQRLTQAGLVDYKKMMAMGFVMLFISFLFGLPVVVAGGYPIIIIGLLSLFLAYSYTGGPFPLAYLGLGDIFVFLFFGLIAVGGSYYIQTLELNLFTLVVGAQIGFLAVSLIAINNQRDREEDLKAKKLTLAARFGDGFAKTEVILCTLAPYLLGLLFLKEGWLRASTLVFISLPLAMIICKRVWSEKVGSGHNKILALAGLHHMLFGCLLCVGIFFS